MSSIWKKPWCEVDSKQAQSIHAQLNNEVRPGHQLYGQNLTAIARMSVCDDTAYDVAFDLHDGRYAVVHLMKSGIQKGIAETFPSTTIYLSMSELLKIEVSDCN